MIKIYQPPPVWNLPSMSPFCVKLETYMRMTKVDYKVLNGTPVAAPKRKVPYVEIDGQIMGDSELIIQLLKKKFGDPLDEKLSVADRALANAFQRMVEEHLYFASAYLRWTDASSLAYVREVFRSLLPPIIGPLIFKQIRKNFLKAIYAQGMGRHSREEILGFAKTDLLSLSVFLGEKPYFLGPQPTSLDATMYGFLIQQIWVPWDSPLKQYAQTLSNLVRFCERMKQQYWL